ncbi:MAG: hypothetical protein O3A51_08175 [Verrucomicrobia bacterium]|nr:hypothetical protein [Verrucomicrobiota bacterium]
MKRIIGIVWVGLWLVGAVQAADPKAETDVSTEPLTLEQRARAHHLPKGWLTGVGGSGYEKALEIQAESGLDILVMFFRLGNSSEKGLLRWFEKKGMNNSRVTKQMRYYIKVKIDADQNDRRTRALMDEYHVGKTPRLVVRQPNGWTRRVDVFDWPNNEPELASHLEIVERLKAASSAGYQTDDD